MAISSVSPGASSVVQVQLAEQALEGLSPEDMAVVERSVSYGAALNPGDQPTVDLDLKAELSKMLRSGCR